MLRGRKLATLALVSALGVAAAPARAEDSSAAPGADPRFAQMPAITFRAINTRETASLRLYRDDGSLDPAALDQLAHLLRDLPTGRPSPVVPRTVQLLLRVVTHFNATEVDIVSGYRSGLNANGHHVHREGYHSVGSAIDFELPGVDMATVAAYARTFAHVGVGWYPTSGFVHLDSREQTFLWENRAGHGHHGWDRPLDRHDCAARDAAWTAAEDLPWDPPGATVALDLHPHTVAGAHVPHHHHGHHGHRTARAHPPLHVFRGATP